MPLLLRLLMLLGILRILEAVGDVRNRVTRRRMCVPLGFVFGKIALTIVLIWRWHGQARARNRSQAGGAGGGALPEPAPGDGARCGVPGQRALPPPRRAACRARGGATAAPRGAPGPQ